MAVAEVATIVAGRKTVEGARMGDELENIRREAGFTQQQVADRLGMTLQGYLGYRKGYSRVNQQNLTRWAKALNTPPSRLAERLGIELVPSTCAGNLLAEITALLGPDNGEEAERLLRSMADLPPSDQRQILDTIRYQVTGRHADLSQRD